MPEITMGEATKAAQGYATQVWVPHRPKPAAQGTAALIHNRTDFPDQPGVFFVPGNRFAALLKPGTEEHFLTDADGVARRLRIPDAVLWENHGGPCEFRGARYRDLGRYIMPRVVQVMSKTGGKPIIIPGESIGTNQDYVGPFDYVLPQDPPEKDVRPTFTLMNLDLLRRR